MDDQQEDKIPQYRGLCPECHAGILLLRRITYFTWLNEELITVPNFPAWICDVCGRREYDGRTILWLNTLLNHEVGRRPSAHHRPRRRPRISGVDQALP
jgi:YgiT-type zinc finger domain-containing protein